MRDILPFLDKYPSIILLDVGFHKGDFSRDFSKRISPLNKYLHVIGIDPIDYGSESCNVFIKAAVSTQEGVRIFNTYSEPGCNSLNEMLLENKFQRPQEIQKTGEIEVNCERLDRILDALNPEFIHYFKIDAQGNDRDVLQSGEKWLPKCLFVQMETCVAKTADTLMYKNQNTRDSDIEYMLSKDFELFDEWDHSAVSCPEADLIFFNRKLYDEN